MTPKQRRFAEEYVVDLNAVQAAMRAGYKKSAARTYGAQLLRRPDVAAFVAEAQAARAARVGLTADRVVNELAKVAFGDPRKLFTWDKDGLTLRDSAGLSDAQAAQVSEISESLTPAGVKTQHIRLHGKMTALMALAKHLGLLAGPAKAPSGHQDESADGDEAGDADDAGDAREDLARRIAGLAARLEAGNGAGGDPKD